MKITISMQEAKEILVAKYAFMLGCSKEEFDVEIQDTEGGVAVNTEADSEGWIVNDIDSLDCPDHLKGKIIEVIYEDTDNFNEKYSAEALNFRLGHDWSVAKYRILN